MPSKTTAIVLVILPHKHDTEGAKHVQANYPGRAPQGHPARFIYGPSIYLSCARRHCSDKGGGRAVFPDTEVLSGGVRLRGGTG